MELHQFAKYPFLKDSLQWVKESGPELEELLKSSLYARARALGELRVKEALEAGEIKEHDFSTQGSQLMELLSYPIARMLVSSINDGFLIRRYALGEAKLMYKRLLDENIEFILRLAQELGLEVASDQDKFKVHLSTYLKYSSGLRGSGWKLVNRELAQGWVVLAKKDTVRLFQEGIKQKIERELPLPVGSEIEELFVKQLKELRNLTESRKKLGMPKAFGEVTILKFPPCMRRLLNLIESGENVPHAGRFALTTFLNAIGMSSEDILKIFSTAPDFEEKTTRYQIEHITGKISGTTYKPPECHTLKTYGLCFAQDELCKREWLTHPLKYYRAKRVRKL